MARPTILPPNPSLFGHVPELANLVFTLQLQTVRHTKGLLYISKTKATNVSQVLGSRFSCQHSEHVKDEKQKQPVVVPIAVAEKNYFTLFVKRKEVPLIRDDDDS